MPRNSTYPFQKLRNNFWFVSAHINRINPLIGSGFISRFVFDTDPVTFKSEHYLNLADYICTGIIKYRTAISRIPDEI